MKRGVLSVLPEPTAVLSFALPISVLDSVCHLDAHRAGGPAAEKKGRLSHIYQRRTPPTPQRHRQQALLRDEKHSGMQEECSHQHGLAAVVFLWR